MPAASLKRHVSFFVVVAFFPYNRFVMMHFIVGLIIVAIGFSVVAKTDFYLEFLGRSEFAEAKLGPGMSRTFYKLLGSLICFIGILVATNVIQSIVLGVFGPLFVSLTPGK